MEVQEENNPLIVRNMRILFLVYHGFSDASGITKKIHYKVKGLRENGHEVHLCYYGFDQRGHRCRFIDNQVIQDYGIGKLAAIRQRLDYDCIYEFCKVNGIQFVYARCNQNANPFLIRLFKRLNKLGIISVTEVPTYPYDQEFFSFNWRLRFMLRIDQLFRKRLAREMAAIVTFSDAERIFGQRTIRISTGVDFDSVPTHQYHPDGSIHLIGVAELHIWHAFDRLLVGLGEYYAKTKKPKNVIFHIVGYVHPYDLYKGNVFHPSLLDIIDKYSLQDKVIFHGQLFGEALDEVFNLSCFAIGSLGRHRSGITAIKTLKNREYATRGIPFIYSEQDNDFDHQPYVLKSTPYESPINIQKILDFLDSHHFNPKDIRNTVNHLSWKRQMKKVMDEV